MQEGNIRIINALCLTVILSTLTLFLTFDCGAVGNTPQNTKGFLLECN